MNVGDNVTITLVGKVIKKELYKDGSIRACIENDKQEIAIVIDKEPEIVQ